MTDTSTAPSTATPQPPILFEDLGDGIIQIRLNRPDRLNAMGVDMVREFHAAVQKAVALPARVLLIRGSGRAFCAGADLKERRGMDDAAKVAHNRAINAAVDAVDAAPMPTIAVLNGLALGGGCEIAVACDLRYGAEDISIGLTEARIGAIPGAGGTQRLPRVIGAAKALELMLIGEPVNGKRAEDIGLLHAAVPGDQLDEHVLAIARVLASRSPMGARTMKRLVHRGLEVPLTAGLTMERASLPEIFSSADYAEGLASFAERRPAKFTGK